MGPPLSLTTCGLRGWTHGTTLADELALRELLADARREIRHATRCRWITVIPGKADLVAVRISKAEARRLAAWHIADLVVQGWGSRWCRTCDLCFSPF